jgi:ribosomal protein S14
MSVKTSLGDLHASSVVVAKGYLDVGFPQKCHLIASATHFSGPSIFLQQSATPRDHIHLPFVRWLESHIYGLGIMMRLWHSRSYSGFRGTPWYSYRGMAVGVFGQTLVRAQSILCYLEAGIEKCCKLTISRCQPSRALPTASRPCRASPVRRQSAASKAGRASGVYRSLSLSRQSLQKQAVFPQPIICIPINKKQSNDLFVVAQDDPSTADQLKEAPNIPLCSPVWVTHAV